MAVVEAALIIVERYFEAKLLHQYHSQGDFAWLGLTLAFLWFPGVVFMVTFVVEGVKKSVWRNWRFLWYMVSYCLLFPISTLVW